MQGVARGTTTVKILTGQKIPNAAKTVLRLTSFVCILVHVKWRATHKRTDILLSIYSEIFGKLSCITKEKLDRPG